MPISTMQWPIKIRIFNAECEVRFPTTTSQNTNCTLYFRSLGIRFVFILLMLLVCSDVKKKPPPPRHEKKKNERRVLRKL